MHEILNYIFHLIVPVAHAAEEAEASGSFVSLLGINWKLFIAQLINFVIVLLILWKWVLGPLGKKLEERSAKIEKSLKQTEEIEAKHKEAEEFRLGEIEKARIEASDIVNKAQKAAEQTKEQILIEARESSEKLIEQAKKEMEAQKSKLLSEVREEAAQMIVVATEKVIKEKLDLKKDEQLIKESLKNV